MPNIGKKEHRGRKSEGKRLKNKQIEKKVKSLPGISGCF